MDDNEKEGYEDTIQKVITEPKDKANITITTDDIDIAHRLGRFEVSKRRQIIVKFVKRTTKITVLRARKLLREHKLYVNEDLTSLNQEVFNSVRTKLLDEVEAAWTCEGKINYKLKEDDVSGDGGDINREYECIDGSDVIEDDVSDVGSDMGDDAIVISDDGESFTGARSPYVPDLSDLSEDECSDLEKSQVETKRELIMLTFYKTSKILNGHEISSVVSVENDYYMCNE